jgi:hypothetical protein
MQEQFSIELRELLRVKQSRRATADESSSAYRGEDDLGMWQIPYYDNEVLTSSIARLKASLDAST